MRRFYSIVERKSFFPPGCPYFQNDYFREDQVSTGTLEEIVMKIRGGSFSQRKFQVRQAIYVYVRGCFASAGR